MVKNIYMNNVWNICFRYDVFEKFWRTWTNQTDFIQTTSTHDPADGANVSIPLYFWTVAVPNVGPMCAPHAKFFPESSHSDWRQFILPLNQWSDLSMTNTILVLLAKYLRFIYTGRTRNQQVNSWKSQCTIPSEWWNDQSLFFSVKESLMYSVFATNVIWMKSTYSSERHFVINNNMIRI